MQKAWQSVMVEYGAACYQPATLCLVEVCEQVSVFKLWVEQLGRRPGMTCPRGHVLPA